MIGVETSCRLRLGTAKRTPALLRPARTRQRQMRAKKTEAMEPHPLRIHVYPGRHRRTNLLATAMVTAINTLKMANILGRLLPPLIPSIQEVRKEANEATKRRPLTSATHPKTTVSAKRMRPMAVVALRHSGANR